MPVTIIRKTPTKPTGPRPPAPWPVLKQGQLGKLGPKFNPSGWLDTEAAAELLGVDRAWLVRQDRIPRTMAPSRRMATVADVPTPHRRRSSAKTWYFPRSEIEKLRVYWGRYQVTDLLDAEQAAKFMGVSVRTVRKMEAAGDLPQRVQIGPTLYYRRSEVKAVGKKGRKAPYSALAT